MKEPRRLLTDTETSALGRSLLAAGRARREPEGARERVWSAVGIGLASGAATASASAGARVKGITLVLGKMKLLVVGAVVITAAGAAVVAMNRDQPAAAMRAALRPAPAAPAAPAANDAKPETVPEALPQPLPVPESSVQVRGNATPRKSSAASGKASTSPLVKTTPAEDEPARPVAISKLREEAALLQEARAALGRGDTVAARAKLADARARFPNGQLGEERDALDVRLASDSGDRARAASLARAFVERYPDSPLRAGVESIGRAPEKF